MSKTHGTPLTTQFVKVLNAVTTAVATAVGVFSIADLLNVITTNGEKLTQYLRLVFTALTTSKELVLMDDKTQAGKPSLLESLSAVALVTVKKFAASDYFKVGTGSGVTIAYLGDNFKKYFLKKTETDVAAATLRLFKLKEASLDPPIITELGSNHETTLAHLWELLKLQPNGEPGILLTNGCANIFYIRDTEGILWAVSVYWIGDGWHVYAHSVGNPRRWDADYQVFGR